MSGRGRTDWRPAKLAFWAGIIGFALVFPCFAEEAETPAEGEEAAFHPVLDAGNRETLSVGYAERWQHEDGTPAEEEQYATLGEEALAELADGDNLAARRAELAEVGAKGIEAALEKSEARIEELTKALPVAQRDIRRLKVQALTESPKSKEIRQKIKDLEEELEAYADNLPEVQARRAAIEAITRNLMEELKFRREIRGLLEQPTLEP